MVRHAATGRRAVAARLSLLLLGVAAAAAAAEDNTPFSGFRLPESFAGGADPFRAAAATHGGGKHKKGGAANVTRSTFAAIVGLSVPLASLVANTPAAGVNATAVLNLNFALGRGDVSGPGNAEVFARFASGAPLNPQGLSGGRGATLSGAANPLSPGRVVSFKGDLLQVIGVATTSAPLSALPLRRAITLRPGPLDPQETSEPLPGSCAYAVFVDGTGGPFGSNQCRLFWSGRLAAPALLKFKSYDALADFATEQGRLGQRLVCKLDAPARPTLVEGNCTGVPNLPSPARRAQAAPTQARQSGAQPDSLASAKHGKGGGKGGGGNVTTLASTISVGFRARVLVDTTAENVTVVVNATYSASLSTLFLVDGGDFTFFDSSANFERESPSASLVAGLPADPLQAFLPAQALRFKGALPFLGGQVASGNAGALPLQRPVTLKPLEGSAASVGPTSCRYTVELEAVGADELPFPEQPRCLLVFPGTLVVPPSTPALLRFKDYGALADFNLFERDVKVDAVCQLANATAPILVFGNCPLPVPV